MRLLASTFVTAFLAAAPALAQATLPYDHMHLAAPDQAAAVAWYQKTFGGKTTPEGKDRLLFGKTRFIWLKSENAQPSAGAAIDHIAFSVANRKPGFMTDPWGVRIEIVNDPQVRGFHHVHLRSSDPTAALKWYQQRFGGEHTTYKGEDALKYGDVLLMVEKTTTPAAASVGHAIDHLGWRVTDLDKTLSDLAGIKVLQGVTNLQLATGPVRYSFVEDPAGAKIELVQRQGVSAVQR
jgi:catechol 2,3-dioxygenase-like lactoylglutathione lyase family enzyme